MRIADEWDVGILYKELGDDSPNRASYPGPELSHHGKCMNKFDLGDSLYTIVMLRIRSNEWRDKCIR